MNAPSADINLRLDFVSHQAASYAVKRWHYSANMPNAKLIKIGVWENNKFIGVVIFGRGANNNMLKPYGLKVSEGCELVRIALTEHKTAVSKIISVAIKVLIKANPGLKLIVSYADSRQQHLGTIYQASNWVYTGIAHTTPDYFYRGMFRHQRSVNLAVARGVLTRGERSKLETRDGGFRFRYLYPLDKEIAVKIEKLRKDYPKEFASVA